MLSKIGGLVTVPVLLILAKKIHARKFARDGADENKKTEETIATDEPRKECGRSNRYVDVDYANEMDMKCITVCRFITKLFELPPFDSDVKTASQERNCGFYPEYWTVGDICSDDTLYYRFLRSP